MGIGILKVLTPACRWTGGAVDAGAIYAATETLISRAFTLIRSRMLAGS